LASGEKDGVADDDMVMRLVLNFFNENLFDKTSMVWRFLEDFRRVLVDKVLSKRGFGVVLAGGDK
jgi:hypothetical protein